MSLWIFGYGSLMWRPAFAHTERQVGTIRGWTRRFWQGSPDHRGIPDAPGRVVTLVPTEEPERRCLGVAYRIDAEDRDEILARLDHREVAGYERFTTQFELAQAPASHRQGATVEVLVYIAGRGNENYLGPATLDEIAAHVCTSAGPSGSNVEYVLELARALRESGAPYEDDEHAFSVEQHVRARLANSRASF